MEMRRAAPIARLAVGPGPFPRGAASGTFFFVGFLQGIHFPGRATDFISSFFFFKSHFEP